MEPPRTGGHRCTARLQNAMQMWWWRCLRPERPWTRPPKSARHCFTGGARKGHAEVVATLLAAGPAKDGTATDGCAVLHEAASNSHAEVVAAVLEAEVAVDGSAKESWTPLDWAARNGHAKFFKALLAAGATKDGTATDE